MKRYFYSFFLFSISCLAQENTTSNKSEEILSYNKVDLIPIFENCKNEKHDLQRDCVVNFINTHIEKNLKYPEEAKKAIVESKVFCTFTIDEEGKITVTEAKGKTTSFKKAFENEAIRLLNLLPKFIPAKHNNQIVKVQAQYTIEFKLENSSSINVNEAVTSYPVSVIAAEISEEYLDEAVPFSVVEQIPLFETCKNVEKKEQLNCFQEEMKKHIMIHLKYPKEAKKNKVEARVIVMFEIEKEGTIGALRARGPKNGEIFETEAKRIISLLPVFIPGTQRKKPVVVSYSIPISFKL